jgi:hypothetical protein
VLSSSPRTPGTPKRFGPDRQALGIPGTPGFQKEGDRIVTGASGRRLFPGLLDAIHAPSAWTSAPRLPRK